MAKYPPYVNAYGKISTLFTAIRKASVPPKFTHDFLSSVLGLKSSSDRAFVPLLKRLKFLDTANVPTKAYKDYRGTAAAAKKVMAAQVREAYPDVFTANEYAHNLSKADRTTLVRRITGAAEDDSYIPAVVATLDNLIQLGDFSAGSGTEPATHPPDSERKLTPTPTIPQNHQLAASPKLGISYTINLNLPASTEVEVFNAIFKALKEHILNELD